MRTVTSSLPLFEKVNKHVPQVGHIECFNACACLGLLAHVHVYLFYIRTTVYACKCVCVLCVVVGVGATVEGCVYVCEYCMHIKKKKRSWDESGAAHVETLSAETVSMRSIMRQG